MRPIRTEPRETAAAVDWHDVPVLWLAIALFAASLAGCVLMIVLGARHVDVALPTAGGEIMKMPLARAPPASQPGNLSDEGRPRDGAR